MPNRETKTIGGIAVIGPLGAGKSTFLNKLAGKDIFKTSDEAEGCT
jgi:GTPase Era involved in 16S rRNA processing